mgnify:CR=1 FL=1
MAKDNKKLVQAITSQEENFAQWYTDICVKAELVEYSSVKGFIILRPYGQAIWELIQKDMDARFKATGHENVAMPVLIPESLLKKEGELVNGFAPEVAWVTMGGSDTLRGYEDDQFRGNSMLKATLEYRFPIVKKVQGVLFTDNGYAWDKRHEDEFDMGLLKNSYGVGLRINSPLGPVKLDYGYGEDGGKFHFSFGGQF